MRALKNDMGDRQWFVLYVVVCIEVGIFLTLVPWSAIWERNYFLDLYPSLRALLLAPTVRGAVAGLGVANLYMGLRELLHRRRALFSEESPIPQDPDPGGSPVENRTVGDTDREAIVGAEDRR
jgi:hypothetical protein